MSVRKITVLDRQSVWDLAIQEYGAVEGVFLLMADNSGKGLSFETNPRPGLKLKIISAAVIQSVVDYYRVNNIKPATASPASSVYGGDYNDDYNNDYTNLLAGTEGPPPPPTDDFNDDFNNDY